MLRRGRETRPFRHLRVVSSFPSLLLLFRQFGSKVVWPKEAEVLGTGDGLMPGRVQDCWHPGDRKEKEPTKSWM